MPLGLHPCACAGRRQPRSTSAFAAATRDAALWRASTAMLISHLDRVLGMAPRKLFDAINRLRASAWMTRLPLLNWPTSLRSSRPIATEPVAELNRTLDFGCER